MQMAQIVRETPAPEPLHCGADGPSHPSVDDEPVLDVDEIQGNILAGFNKDIQTLVFFRVHDPVQFKDFLRERINTIATLGEVAAFNRLFKSMRTRLRAEPPIRATW